MIKRIFKALAVIALVITVAVAAFVLNALLGNPVSKALATKNAEAHLAKNYDGDFIIDEVSYSFKDGKYYAYVTSPSSIDSSFTIFADGFGRPQGDSYEERVLSGRNTADRIYEDYRKITDPILQAEDFPYEMSIYFGELIFTERLYKDDPDTPSYALITEELTRDGEYDANLLGAICGEVTIYIFSEDLSYENLAEKVLTVKGIFDEARVNFHSINLVLEHPDTDGRVEVRRLLYEDIYEDGMAERAKVSHEAAMAYYENTNEQDKK